MDEFPEDFDAGTILTEIREKDVLLKKLRKSIYDDVKEHGYYNKTLGCKTDGVFKFIQILALIAHELKIRGFYINIDCEGYKESKDRVLYSMSVHSIKILSSYDINFDNPEDL